MARGSWWVRVWAGAVMLGVVAGIGWSAEPGTAPVRRWALLAYLSDEPDLTVATQGYLDKLQYGTRGRPHTVLAQSGCRRYRLSEGQCHTLAPAAVCATPPDALADFVRWGRGRAEGRQLGLIVVGHGTPVALLQGPFAECTARPGIVLGSGAEPLEPAALAAAVRRGLGGGDRKLDALFLDCCYGASIESASLMRDVTRTFVGCPGLLHTPGLPWDLALRRDLLGGTDPGEALADAVCTALAQHQTQSPSELVAFRESRIDDVLRALAAFARELTAGGESLSGIVTSARAKAPGWGRARELCDLVAFADLVALQDPGSRVAEEARNTQAAVYAARVSQTLAPGRPEGFENSAVAVFFPPALQRLPAMYSKDAMTGGYEPWATFVGSYLNGIRRLIP